MNFSEFNLDTRVLEGIEAMGYEKATPVQEQAIPPILEGRDILATAQTGTGKTAAFLLPLIHKIVQENTENHHIKALVIAPTRELAIQIDQQMEGFSYFANVSSLAVYGGSDGDTFSKEKKALTEGADIIIGTPGRVISHLNMGYVKVGELKYLVLDEADRMLNMGFYDDIMKIISFLPKKRQNLLFSATMPPKVKELTTKVLHDPVEISIAISKPAERVTQVAFVVHNNQKIPLAKFLLSAEKLKSVIVFCSTKSSTKELARDLKRSGASVEEIHSDLDQETRGVVLRKFKNREIKALIATDILSRGIDVEDIDLVLNFDVPNDGEDYIHRIGRTARAASKGLAITFVNEKEQGKFAAIEKLLGGPVKKAPIPVQFGEGPEYKPYERRQREGGRPGGRSRFSKGKKKSK